MNSKEYQAEILRTYAGSNNSHEKLVLGALGLAGETGEVVDHIKKVEFAGHALDIKHLTEELGDVLWYAGLICNAVGCTLDDILEMNVAKLRKRYPNGFDPERSINR